jgi:hypothetical protein
VLGWTGGGAFGEKARQLAGSGGDACSVLPAEDAGPGRLGLEQVPPTAGGRIASAAVRSGAELVAGDRDVHAQTVLDAVEEDGRLPPVQVLPGSPGEYQRDVDAPLSVAGERGDDDTEHAGNECADSDAQRPSCPHGPPFECHQIMRRSRWSRSTS